MAAAAGANDDRSLPPGEGRSAGRAVRGDAMRQVEAEIAGDGEAEGKAAMAEGGGEPASCASGIGWRGWRGVRPLGFEPDNVWHARAADWVAPCWAGCNGLVDRANMGFVL